MIVTLSFLCYYLMHFLWFSVSVSIKWSRSWVPNMHRFSYTPNIVQLFCPCLILQLSSLNIQLSFDESNSFLTPIPMVYIKCNSAMSLHKYNWYKQVWGKAVESWWAQRTPPTLEGPAGLTEVAEHVLRSRGGSGQAVKKLCFFSICVHFYIQNILCDIPFYVEKSHNGISSRLKF